MAIPQITLEDIRKVLGSPIIKTLEDNGITPESLALELKAELEAEDVEVVGKGKNRTEVAKPLWAIRQKARQDAHRLMGHYPPEKSGDTYMSLIMQQNNLILSPVVKQLLENHTKALTSFIKNDDDKGDVVDVEVKE